MLFSPMFTALPLCLVPVASVASSLLPEPTSQAIQYQNSQDWFWGADHVMGLAVPLLVLFSGVAGRLAKQCYRLSHGRWFLAIALFAIAYATIDFSLNLPVAFWEGYVNEHHFRLGTGSVGQWLKEQGVGYLVTLIAVSLLTWVPYFFMQATPRLWWLWSAVAFLPVFILMHIVSPIWIAPLTNRFEPLADKSLEAKIDALAMRAGITGATILVKDESRSSKLPNAGVRGMFGTTRIVINDNLIELTDERELLVVVAFIRNVEHNADLFALDLTLDNDAAMSVIRKAAGLFWYVPNPGWFRRNFRTDHPPLDERARFLASYRPQDPNPQGH